MAKLAQTTEKAIDRRLIQNRILLVVGTALILVGVAPLLYLLWDGSRNYNPLSMPLTLTQGQYTSPWFTPDVSDTWQIDLNRTQGFTSPQVDSNRPDANAQPIPLSINWQVVDSQGSPIAQGIHSNDLMFGNEVHLGTYTTRSGLRQRILLNVVGGVQSENVAQAILRIEDPEPSLDISYAFFPALVWLAIFASCGIIVLIVAAFRRINPSKLPSVMKGR